MTYFESSFFCSIPLHLTLIGTLATEHTECFCWYVFRKKEKDLLNVNLLLLGKCYCSARVY